MNKQKQAIIAGGSIAGLTAGLALRQRGWSVDIFEATHGELDQRGAGIITHPSLFETLDTLNVRSEDELGIHIRTRKAFSSDGAVTNTLDLPQIATSWGRMYQLLKQAFPIRNYHQPKALKNYQQYDTHVDVWFADGTHQACDLLIAADGIRSTVRQHLEPESKPEYAGYVAWRGLIDEQLLSTQEKADVFPYFTFCLPDGEQVLTYPIAGRHHQTEVGQRRCNVVWYRPAAFESTLQNLLTDTNGNNNGESIAPDKVRPCIVNRMQQEATSLLSPQHAGLIKKLVQPFIQPIYDLTTKTMVHGRIAVIGDAAFTARPHLGVGITKAADDAMALADALERHTNIPEALQYFNDARYPASFAWVARSRELGAYLQAQLLSQDERRFAQQHRATDAVMRETASLVYQETPVP